MAAKKWKPVRVTHVEDVIAEDWWELRRFGKRFVVHLAVGRSKPDPSGRDWYCPVLVEGLPELKGWRPFYGVGPVDSTTNAFMFISRMFHEYGPKPLGRPPRKRRTQLS